MRINVSSSVIERMRLISDARVPSSEKGRAVVEILELGRDAIPELMRYATHLSLNDRYWAIWLLMELSTNYREDVRGCMDINSGVLAGVFEMTRSDFFALAHLARDFLLKLGYSPDASVPSSGRSTDCCSDRVA